ncbi:MAG TPA: glycosyltransferase [Streptosporangiaceae bacterium]|nr:glycosyltransferase [Streptosporangiaceae bacterium]
MISIVIVSKDEEALDQTLADVAAQVDGLAGESEIVVVDASDGRLDHIRRRHEAAVRWVPFQRPPGVRVSIAHQRNAGVREARGEIIVFTDAGCRPRPGWLASLVAPLQQDERMTSGVTLATSGNGLYDPPERQAEEPTYLPECPTLNVAFRREVFDAVGGFDERFAYGSDVDFCWRLGDAGYCIRSVPGAVIEHDYGTWRRQLRRSYTYGKARARLYRKHRARLRHILRTDPMVVVYPLFLLGLPLTLIFPLYPALLLIPAWRNRSYGAGRVLVDHLTFGAGVLVELART